jgi:hypothetical protein
MRGKAGVSLLARILDRLYLGDKELVLTLEGMNILKREGIGFILNVAKEVDYRYPVPEGIEVLKVGLEDGKPIPKDELKKAVNFIGASVAKGKVLVHCSAGLSRSPAIIIAYLIRVGLSFPTARRIVEHSTIDAVRAHSLVSPAMELLDSIREVYGKDFFEG